MSSDSQSLDAVARVRRVREQDSRQGLVIAQREVEEARQRLAGHEQRLRELGTTEVADAGALLRLREGLLALGDLIVEARDGVGSAQLVATSALAHWQQDRMQLRAIEMLQERRRERVRAERARAQARVDDEVATQMWLRTSADATAGAAS